MIRSLLTNLSSRRSQVVWAKSRTCRAMQTFSDSNLAGLLAWWNGIDTFLIDCDGVLWRSTEGVPGVDETLNAMRSSGKRVLFVTNNSTKSRADYVSKLQHIAGIHALEPEILSSAYAAAIYCKDAGMTKKVYVVGQDGLVEELRRVGLQVLGPDDSSKPFHFGTFKPSDLDNDVEAVVAGFDGSASYFKLAVACSYLRYRPDVRFVATNRDLSFPDTHQLVPGGGMMIAALEAGSGRTPDVVAGKPALGLLDIASSALGGPTALDRSRTCMIGDRLDTDILFGNTGGLGSTLLVLTGVSGIVEVDALPPGDKHRPTHAIASLGDLFGLLQKAGWKQGDAV